MQSFAISRSILVLRRRTIYKQMENASPESKLVKSIIAARRYLPPLGSPLFDDSNRGRRRRSIPLPWKSEKARGTMRFRNYFHRFEIRGHAASTRWFSPAPEKEKDLFWPLFFEIVLLSLRMEVTIRASSTLFNTCNFFHRGQ